MSSTLACSSCAQRLRLRAPVGEREPPRVGELPREPLRVRAGVGLVDEAEVLLEPVEHGRVRAEQRGVVGEQPLEHALPPRELQLGADPLRRHVPAGEVLEQRREVLRLQPVHDRLAVLQVLEHVGVGGERGEAVADVVDRLLEEGVRRPGQPERIVERGQVG